MYAREMGSPIVEVLRGDHRDAVTAYRSTQPPGKRHWLETATKGQMKGRCRYVTQTRATESPEEWNDPVRAQYYDRIFLVLHQDGTVGPYCFNRKAGDPQGFAWIVRRGLWAALNDTERMWFAEMIERLEPAGRSPWQRWAQDIAAIRAAGAPDSAHRPASAHSDHEYSLLRDYIAMGGPDIRAPRWWMAAPDGESAAPTPKAAGIEPTLRHEYER